ncbi:alpha/beta hydrolase [Geodermatophilus sp. URMC 61]|uniref:alpha/beta hydrolase n=1 Tax=Geodermatophilus sp. URMC 61 TaxID=3423411 RepID=UPI00406C0C41
MRGRGPIQVLAREIAVAGRPAAPRSRWGSLIGRTTLTIFIHGFNNSEPRATDTWEKTYSQLCDRLSDRQLDQLVLYYWPGDATSRQATSAPLYFSRVPQAAQCGQDLASYLAHLAQRIKTLRLQIVAHSLGSRVALETIRALGGHPKVRVENVLLLAAAVPAGLCEDPRRYGKSHAAKEVVVHSRNDDVLRRSFPAGQWMARHMASRTRRDPDPGPLKEAVGYRGKPTTRWSGEPDSSGLRHGEYWTNEGVIDRIASLLGRRATRTLAERAPRTRETPQRNPRW